MGNVYNKVLGTHYPCPAVIALAPCHQMDWVQSPLSRLQHVHKTAPQYLQELVSQYNPPCSLRSSSLCRLSISGFGENTKQKTFRSNIVPQCCTHPLDQAARQTSPSKRHCFFLAAAEIRFVFNFVIPSYRCPLSFPHVFLPLISISTPPPPQILTIFFTKHNERGIFLPGVRLCSTSGHWH